MDTNPQNHVEVALRRFARAVVIVTTRHGEKCKATPVAAAVASPLPPATLLISADPKTALVVPTEGETFGVNILDESQEYIARMCGAGVTATPYVDEWHFATCGAPVLSWAYVSFACIARGSSLLGTHTTLLGEVMQVRDYGGTEPLIYCDQQYGRFLPNTRQII